MVWYSQIYLYLCNSVNDLVFNSSDCFYLRMLFYHECVSHIVYFWNVQVDAAFPQIHAKFLPQQTMK